MNAEIPGLKIDPETVLINIVFFEITKEHLTAETLVNLLDQHGVIVLPTGKR